MPNFKTATAFLLLSNFAAAQLPGGGENCAPIEELGTPNLDRFDFSVSMDVDDSCEYELKFSFKHDDTLPIPTDPAAQCDPTIVPPQMASDGMPYFAFRWYYESLSDEIKAITGMDHLSIDWNPCGHPPVDVFGAPHYDLHIYRETPEFRTCMTCDVIPGTPVCNPAPGAQTTANGLAFFDVAVVEPDEAAAIQRVVDPNAQPSNMPPGYRVPDSDMVALMGGHGWNPNHEPPSALEWTNPIWIMGPYNGDIANYEQMMPMPFFTGETDNVWAETFTYEGQTITELPTSMVASYDATTGVITVTLTGPSADGSCEVVEPELIAEETPVQVNELPFIGDLIERAYPTWCIDENEDRIYDVDTCEDGTPNGRWSPLYFTKQYSGADPALGGYPGNIDIVYPFEFAAPFLGQACAGTPHMCPEDFPGDEINCKKCPKLKTTDDNGPYGPGHVPPHISLAALSWAYEQGKGGDISTWFNFEANACRILPSKLLSLIRIYYPREEDGSVYYPPPFSDAGGAYPLEFVNLAGETCKKEGEKHSTAGFLECFEHHSGDVSLYPDYLEVGHGSPHYCTKDGKAADINPDYCPYIFFGPHRGKYRHPHIAFSAVEVYLSNLLMPDKCGTTWDDSNYPPAVDTTTAFPYMSEVTVEGDGILSHPEQPTIDEDGMWIWPGPDGPKKKPVIGNFAVNMITVQDATWTPNQSSDMDVDASEDGGYVDMEDSGSATTMLSFAFSAMAMAVASLLL